MPTSHFPNGVTNVNQAAVHGLMPQLDPTKCIVFEEDFIKNLDITATSPNGYTVTKVEAGAGSASIASANGAGGLLLITNDAADDDSVSIQTKSEFFKHSDRTKNWSMSYRLKISDATQSDLLIGLAITDTTPLANTDGIYFTKADGSTTCSLILNKDSTTTTVGSTTLADDTFVVLGARYDATKRQVEMYVNGALVATTTTLTNLCDDEDLAFTLHIQNGEAVAKTCTIDYATVMLER